MKAIVLLFLLLGYIQANQKVILQLSWLNQFQFAGYYVAKEKGFYDKLGIDLEIKEYEHGLDISSVLDNDLANFAIGRTSIIVDKANGKDIVALLSTFQHSPLMILTLDDGSIKNIEDLKNKNVMMTSHAKDSASIIAMLNSKNIRDIDINIQTHSFNLDDLIEKKTDAMASYLSNEPVIFDEKAINYKVFHPKDYGFDFYDDILFTNSSFIKQNPKLTRDFFNATIKGWQYAFDNIGETSQIIFKKYNTQNKSIIELVREGEILKKLALLNDLKEFGNIDAHKLEKIVDVYKVMGLINKDIDFDEFIYEHNNGKVFHFHLSQDEIFKYTLEVLILILIVVFSAIYVMVRKKLLLTNDILKLEIEEKTQQIKELNYIDTLTNAKNRRAYSEKIDECLSNFNRYNTIFSLLYLDIDNFKKINDIFGHKIGDNVLIELVNIIKSRLRNNDTLFRVGGEEFIVIFTQTNLSQAKIAAEDIRKLVEQNLSIKGKEITISLGLTEVKEGDSEEYIYKRADMLLYKSKNSGKNKLSFL